MFKNIRLAFAMIAAALACVTTTARAQKPLTEQDLNTTAELSAMVAGKVYTSFRKKAEPDEKPEATADKAQRYLIDLARKAIDKNPLPRTTDEALDITPPKASEVEKILAAAEVSDKDEPIMKPTLYSAAAALLGLIDKVGDLPKAENEVTNIKSGQAYFYWLGDQTNFDFSGEMVKALLEVEAFPADLNLLRLARSKREGKGMTQTEFNAAINETAQPFIRVLKGEANVAILSDEKKLDALIFAGGRFQILRPDTNQTETVTFPGLRKSFKTNKTAAAEAIQRFFANVSSVPFI